MDADVIKVRLLQEVVLALGSHTIQINPRAHPRARNQADWQLTEEAFFFFPLWPDLDLVFLALGFFFTSLALFLLFLTPGPGTRTAAPSFLPFTWGNFF